MATDEGAGMADDPAKPAGGTPTTEVRADSSATGPLTSSDEAVERLKEAIARMRSATEQGKAEFPGLVAELVSELWQRHRFVEAIPFATELVELLRQGVASDIEAYQNALVQAVFVCLYAGAERLTQAAALVQRSLVAALPQVESEAGRSVLMSLPARLADGLAQHAAPAAAEQFMGEYVEQCRTHATGPEALLLDALLWLARFEGRRNNRHAAQSLLREAIERFAKSQLAGSLSHAIALNQLAQLLMAAGNYQEAEPLLRQALEIRRATSGEASPEYGMSLAALAELLLSARRFKQAEDAARMSLELLDGVEGWERNAPFVMLTLGRCLLAQQRQGEAQEILSSGRAREAASAGPKSMLEVGFCTEIAHVYAESGRFEEAASSHDDALATYLRLGGAAGSDEYFTLLAAPLDLLQRLGNADEVYRRASATLEHLESAGADEHRLCAYILRLGIACLSLNRLDEAERHLRRGVEIAQQESGGRGFEYVSGVANLVELLVRTDRWQETEQLARAALPAARELSEVGRGAVVMLAGRLAIACFELNRLDEAAATLDDVIEQSRSVDADDAQEICERLIALAEECARHGHKLAALRLFSRAREMQQALPVQADPVLARLDAVIRHLRAQLADEENPEVQLLEHAPPGQEHVEVLARCTNAFAREDFTLCVRHALEFDSIGLRTGLMLWLSLLRLDQGDLAKAVGDGLQRMAADHPTDADAALVMGLMSEAPATSVLAAAKSDAERCTACYFIVQRRMVDGDRAEARAYLERAVAYAQLSQEPVLEGELARSALEMLETTREEPSPTDIERAVEKLNESAQFAAKEGRADAALALAKEARDKAGALGADHPTLGRCLLALAEYNDAVGEPAQADELMDKALRILERAFVRNHRDVQSAANRILHSALASKERAHQVHRFVSVLQFTGQASALLLLTSTLQDLVTAPEFPQYLAMALRAANSDPVQRAALRAGVGQIAADEALASCTTDPERCRVLFLAGRWKRAMRDEEAACANFDRAIALDADCVERKLALAEREQMRQPASADPNFRRGPQLEDARALLDGDRKDEAARVIELVERSGKAQEGGSSEEFLLDCGQLYHRAGRLSDAMRVFEQLLQVSSKGGAAYVRSALLQGAICLEVGDLARGKRLLLEARSGMRSFGQAHTPAYLQVLERLLPFVGGEQIQREVLDVAATVHGEESPRFAHVLASVAQTLQAAGNDKEALDAMQRSVGILSRTRGEGSVEVIDAQLTLGTMHLESGNQADGRALLEQCASQIEARAGEDSARLILQLAGAWYSARDYCRAEELARRALGLFVARVEPDRAGRRAALACLGDALQGHGRLREALEVREEAVAAASAELGDESAGLGQALGDLSLTLDALGHTERASATIDRSVRLIHGLARTDA